MIFKNILRRKGRSILTILGISIGVAAIIGLGALANGLEKGYGSMLGGSKADLVLSQPDSMDITYSSVDESIGEELRAMPEVQAVSGMLQGFVQTPGSPVFFLFGYPEDGFILDRFQIKDGVSLNDRELKSIRGKPLLLGKAAAETLKKSVGDTIRMGTSVFRVVGIFETGDAFEDNGAVIGLANAQDLLGKPRQVNLFFIQLKSPELRDRLARRVERKWPDLSLGNTDDFADKQMMGDMLRAYAWGIASIAILIGGIGMMNAQLMAVMERTREIGVLRALGWSSRRVMSLIFGESLVVCLAGGVFGSLIGWLILRSMSKMPGFLGVGGTNISPDLLIQSFVVVLMLGLVGGLYPAWRAARLQPIEALRYEGGTGGGKVKRLPFGGMAVQSLWQRSTRTLLTLAAIGVTVGATMALEAVVESAASSLTDMAIGVNSEIMVREADVADTSLSAIDERIGDMIAAMPEVAHVSGMIFTAVIMPETNGFLIIEGISPKEYAIRNIRVVEGETLASNHQILLGRTMAEALKKQVGDTVDIGGSRFRVTGIYESGVSWEELGGVITLRDAQALAGRPRKVTMYSIKVKDPQKAPALVERINREHPGIHAALTGEFVEQMPDMENSRGMLSGISLMAIIVGGVGVLNTMLMAVLERTREIGVLRALGWRRIAILGMILRESILLGMLGAASGMIIAQGLVYLLGNIPMFGSAIGAEWTWTIFARAIGIAILLGLLGGLYPSFRATRLQPVEALRYE